MLDSHEQRFRRIVNDYLERPAGDYAELLHRGHVSSLEGLDPEAWRGQIRRQARQDKIRVITRRDGQRAFAMLNRPLPEEHAGEVMQRELARGGAPTAGRGRARAGARADRLPAQRRRIRVCLLALRGAHLRPPGGQSVEDGEALTDWSPGA